MSSTVKKERSKPIREKKEKKKKLKAQGAKMPNKNHEEIKKSNIFSALDKIDNKSKEETRAIEEKLRVGLIKSEKSKTVEEIENNEIEKKIENLIELKNKYDENGELDEAIEISKKIITLAFSNNLKAIVNEEKKFLELIEKKVTQKSETIEIPEKKSDLGSTKQEIKNIDISKEKIENEVEKTESEEKKKFEEEKLNFEREKAKFEEKKQRFEEERESFKQERLKLDEEKEVFKWEKQLFEEMKKHERSKEKNIEKKED